MQESRSLALILFSEDEFIKHSVLTICKNEGILSFASQGEEELDTIVGQCLAIKALPLLVFDAPEASDGILNEEKIAALRRQIKGKHPLVATVQMISSSDYRGAMKAYHDGVRAVFTIPSAKTGRATFIEDAILFLQTFTAYIKGFFNERNDAGQERINWAGSRIASSPFGASRALLKYPLPFFSLLPNSLSER